MFRRLPFAKQHKLDASNAKVTCAVSIGPRERDGFGLAVKMRVEDKSIPQAELENLVEEAHAKICPYSQNNDPYWKPCNYSDSNSCE